MVACFNKWPFPVTPIHSRNREQWQRVGGGIEGSIQLNECIPTELLAVETQQTWSGYSPTVNHDASQCSLPLSIVSALFALLPMCQNGSHPRHATSLPWLLPLPVSFTQLSVSLPLTPRITFSPLSHFVFSHQPLSLSLSFSPAPFPPPHPPPRSDFLPAEYAGQSDTLL